MKPPARLACLLLAVALALPAGLVLAAPAGAPAAASAAAPLADGPNLLQNPGFEAPFVKQCCQTDLNVYGPNTPIDEVQVAHGWLAWWLQPDSSPEFPSSCPSCASWHRPEWREANCGNEDCRLRIHTGDNAQKYFTYYSVHEAGMFQQVGGITPASRLRFSAYMQAWSTHSDYGPSSGQQSMGMRVGIDPFGGTNPFSPSIIWSPVSDVYDAWGLYTVEAVARAGTVTVFTRSLPHYAFQHNDIYVDDASLVVVGASGTSPNTGGNPPAPTAVPTPVSGYRYVVQRGDNYYRIARRFGVTVQSIYAANRIVNPNILYVGTVLIIPGVSGPPSTGSSPAPTQPAPAATPTATLSPAEIPGAFTYVVQRGDNLYRLSVRFGTTIARIKQLNNLVGDIIYIGQVLIIAP
jgi:LysM repeat protein